MNRFLLFILITILTLFAAVSASKKDDAYTDWDYHDDTNDIQSEERSHEAINDYDDSSTIDTKNDSLVTLDASLLLNAGHGRINGIDVAIGDRIESVISRLGQPVEDYSMPGTLGMPESGSVSLGYNGFTIQGDVVSTIMVHDSIIHPLLGMEEVKELFGIPVDEWSSRDFSHMYYETDEYSVDLLFNKEGTEIIEITLSH
ncbi:DUF4309 domain-containing protein [Sporosarcina sp. FA9]|uniref:DUF4309 domain-containing protein n=1 Tax=Sporosarcina sp. FA9 TaxID=3413030 RepID=UPI003F65DF85